MAKILITGVNGFFGRNLVKAWRDSHTITGIDYASGVNQTREPFDNWHRSISHIDLIQNPAIREIDQQDVVVHLAARTRINPSWSEYRDYYQTNITASQMFFEQCQLGGVKKFIYFSSSSVYGNRFGPMKESDQLMPTNPYAVSKAAAEMALTAQSLKGQTELIIVRPFTMYGDYMNLGKDSLAIAKFIRAAERDEPLVIEGTGLQERDFIHADDAVHALDLIMAKGRHKDIYNIGTGKYVSIKSIADAISFKQVLAPDRTGPVQRTWADISKLRAMGFAPKVDLLDWLTVYLETNKIYKRIS